MGKLKEKEKRIIPVGNLDGKFGGYDHCQDYECTCVICGKTGTLLHDIVVDGINDPGGNAEPYIETATFVCDGVCMKEYRKLRGLAYLNQALRDLEQEEAMK